MMGKRFEADNYLLGKQKIVFCWLVDKNVRESKCPPSTNTKTKLDLTKRILYFHKHRIVNCKDTTIF